MRTTTTPRFSTRTRRGLAALATVGLLAGPLAACSSESDAAPASASESSPSSASAEQQAPPAPVASIEALTGQDTQIALDQGFVKALTQLKLTPGVVGDAKLDQGTLSFPITGGNVTVFEPGEVSPYVVGQLQHESSGLTLATDDTTVRLSALNVDPGASRVYGDVAVNGGTVASSAYLFELDGRSLEPLESNERTAVLTGTKVKLSPVAAALLNQTYDTKAVMGGLLVGVATITLATGGSRG